MGVRVIRERGVGALTHSAEDPSEIASGIGVARAFRSKDEPSSAEFAVAVIDEDQSDDVQDNIRSHLDQEQLGHGQLGHRQFGSQAG